MYHYLCMIIISIIIIIIMFIIITITIISIVIISIIINPRCRHSRLPPRKRGRIQTALLHWWELYRWSKDVEMSNAQGCSPIKLDCVFVIRNCTGSSPIKSHQNRWMSIWMVRCKAKVGLPRRGAKRLSTALRSRSWLVSARYEGSVDDTVPFASRRLAIDDR